jgi:hypothetical protein
MYSSLMTATLRRSEPAAAVALAMNPRRMVMSFFGGEHVQATPRQNPESSDRRLLLYTDGEHPADYFFLILLTILSKFTHRVEQPRPMTDSERLCSNDPCTTNS